MCSAAIMQDFVELLRTHANHFLSYFKSIPSGYSDYITISCGRDHWCGGTPPLHGRDEDVHGFSRIQLEA